jgi:DNA-binding Lrp family transcriptional regulator
MHKLDLKDRKILYELDLNCRQSNTQIGKKVGLKKDVVNYRIKKLQDEGIISNFYTIINTFRLGYDVYRIYLNFQYVTSDVKQEIIQYFVDNPNSWVVASMKSEIDLDVVMWVKDTYEFYKFWDKTLDKYEEYFEKYNISIYTRAIVYKKSYLLPEKVDSNRIICEMKCGGETIEIDEIDYNLLNEIAVNARIPLIDLAEKLGCSSQTVNYKIKNLVNNGVIQAFRVNLNRPEIGVQNFKVDIYLKEHKLKNPIIKYLEEKPYVEFINFALGWSDLEPEFVVKNFDELSSILDKINTKFYGAIKKQSFFITEKDHKIRCMPKFEK